MEQGGASHPLKIKGDGKSKKSWNPSKTESRVYGKLNKRAERKVFSDRRQRKKAGNTQRTVERSVWSGSSY